MKAWRVHQWGEPESMQWEDVEPPAPPAGHVRIKVHAAAANFFDILQVQGKYQVKPPFPFTPGAEVAGAIDALGEGVTGFSIGQPVLAFASQGAFAEMALAEASRTFAIPAGMAMAEAAALPIVYHTSWFALDYRAKLSAGEWLLVHAGASGVGMSAIQIGLGMGARVIATAGSAAKRQFAKSLGAEFVLDYSDASWVEEVKTITGGRGANVIYDPVGGDILELSTKCIASEGRLLVIGFASGRIPSLAANRALLKNMSLVGVFWGGYVAAHPGYIGETEKNLERLWQQGKIRPKVWSKFPLTECPRALRSLANREVMGKLVLEV